MFCSKCGAQILGDMRFCKECGTPLKNEKAVSVPNNDARWESRSIQIHPAYESEYIEVFETFGWELLSTQTIDKKDSHLENFMGQITSVTESEKYVKLAFRRNKNLSDYKKLAELQGKYENAVVMSEPEDVSAWLVGGGIVLSLIGLFIIGIPMIIVYAVKKKKYSDEYVVYSQMMEEAKLVQYECLNEAKRITDMR